MGGSIMFENSLINVDIFYLEDIGEYLSYISELFLKPSRYLLKKLNSLKTSEIKKVDERSQINFAALTKKYNQLQSEFESNKIILYDEMDLLAAVLKENELFYEEYFDFREIQIIIKYTLDREFSLIESSDLDFILNLVKDFSEFIYFKLDLLEKDIFDENKFESYYTDFLTKFTKSTDYFYENICDETLDDDLFREYTNIIMG